MILLLDTHALLWWLTEDDTLRREAARSIASPMNEVVVSVASIWEVEIKRARGTLRAPADIIETTERAGFSCLSILAGDGVRAARLPPHHSDPFDRMLVAHAMRLDAVIVTRDPAFRAYGVPLLPA